MVQGTYHLPRQCSNEGEWITWFAVCFNTCPYIFFLFDKVIRNACYVEVFRIMCEELYEEILHGLVVGFNETEKVQVDIDKILKESLEHI